MGENLAALAGKANDVNVTTATKATTALELLCGPDGKPEEGVISIVSQLRGKLGAAQNRLEHTLNNLGVMCENITKAESTVRDTDVADEMKAYSKNNILV